MAKLRDDRFLCPGGFSSDSITCLDIIMVKQLSNGACHSMLFKLIMAILRNESSEALRRRYGPNYIFGALLCLLNFLSCYLTFVYVSVFSQYALLLSYFQYCQHTLAPDVLTTVLQQLLLDEQDGEELDLQKVCIL